MSAVASPAGRWAVLPLVFLSATMLGQVVALRGLVAWVLAPMLAACWLVGLACGQGRRLVPWLLALGLGPLVAFLAETIGGETAGPITRSSLVAVSLGCTAVLLSRTRVPASSLIPAAGIAFAAVGLGGAGALLPWTGAWVVLAGATLAFLGPYAAVDLRDARRLGTLIAVLAAGGLAAIVTAVAVSGALGRPWVPPAAVAGPETASAGSATPGPAAVPSAEAAVDSAVDSAADSAVGSVGEPDQWIAWVVAVLAVLGLIALGWLLVALGRRAGALWKWRRLRRQLRRGEPRDALLGAWQWARLRLAHRGHALPVSLSPDTALSWSDAAPVRSLAALVAPAAFDPAVPVEPRVTAEAWAIAAGIERAWLGSWRSRWSQAARGPEHSAGAQVPALPTRNARR